MSKKREKDPQIVEKINYANETFATIPNGKSDVLEEVLYQIKVCYELGVKVTESIIEEWLHCRSAINVQNRARTLKLA